ncbi:MAG TPA: hypothetical protein VN973_04630 [Candidatus Dormibacteraeota bacterium]|nr:hypothetical protein [Candidatus Dormibacteraeota bacterium]
MTLDEEVSAVIVAGFQDPLTAPIAADFKQRQFGGLLVVNNNQNASTPEALMSLIAQLR